MNNPVGDADHPLDLLRMLTQRELVHHLESLHGTKELVVDHTLLRPLDKVTTNSELRNHGVARVISLKGGHALPPLDPQLSYRVYFVRPTVDNTRTIVNHVRAQPDSLYAVIWCNRRLHHCDEFFEKNGIYNQVKSFDLNMCLLPIETDLFSLEHHESASVDIASVASSFHALQSLYGVIPTVYGLGKDARSMWGIVRRLCTSSEPFARPDQPISHLFVFDRNIDTSSVLLTGGTYESMVHEVYTIDCGKASLPSEASNEPTKETVCKLNNNDGIFATIRNQHIAGASAFLSAKAKEVQGEFNKGKANENIRDMKRFISEDLRGLREQHRLLDVHISTCENLLAKSQKWEFSNRIRHEKKLLAGEGDVDDLFNYIEERMMRIEKPLRVLALVCLVTIKLNGIPDNQFKRFVSKFVAAFGADWLPTVFNLGARGILYPKSASSNKGNHSPFATFAKRFNLTEGGEVDLKNPSSMSYVFSGAYTPLCCQIVSDTMTHGWNTTDYKRIFTDSVLVEENSYVPADSRPDNRIRKAIMVFFLGGVTYAEVAALRLLAMQKNFRILIAATHITRRDQFLQARGSTAYLSSRV